MGAMATAHLAPERSKRSPHRGYSRLMRRIERLINLIIALLETPKPMTAREINERVGGYDQENFDAFRRAFERDKEALRSMGIPIEVHREDSLLDDGVDGYSIPKNRYYLPQLDLEPDELAALRIAAEAVLGSTDAAEAGLMKLTLDEGASPSDGPRIVWGADIAAEEPLLAPLYEAMLERHPVRFQYKPTGAETAATRTVESYGLVHRRGHWYLVGRDEDRDAIRAFRVSRMEPTVITLDTTYEVPTGFDADAHLGREAWEIGTDGDRTAVVRFDASMRWWAEQNLRTHPRSEAEGSLDVELQASNLDALVSWVIGFGDGVEIKSPPEARSRLRAHLETFTDGAR